MKTPGLTIVAGPRYHDRRGGLIHGNCHVGVHVVLEFAERTFHCKRAGVHGHLHALRNFNWRFTYAGHRL